MVNVREISMNTECQPLFPGSYPILPGFACPVCHNDDSSRIYATPITRNDQGHLVGGDLICGRCGLEYSPENEDCPDQD